MQPILHNFLFRYYKHSNQIWGVFDKTASSTESKKLTKYEAYIVAEKEPHMNKGMQLWLLFYLERFNAARESWVELNTHFKTQIVNRSFWRIIILNTQKDLYGCQQWESKLIRIFI